MIGECYEVQNVAQFWAPPVSGVKYIAVTALGGRLNAQAASEATVSNSVPHRSLRCSFTLHSQSTFYDPKR